MVIQYQNPPHELILANYGRGLSESPPPVQVHKIIVTIPDEPDWDNGLSYFVAVYDEEKRFCHAILLPIDQTNELLDLIGQKLIETKKNDEVILRDIFSLFF